MPKSGRGEPGWADMKGSLFQDFILHYEAGSREGSAVLYGRGADGAAPGLLYTQLIRENFVRRKRQDGADIIAHMMKGFAVLELICVNLFLYPWRKEIRTLKVDSRGRDISQSASRREQESWLLRATTNEFALCDWLMCAECWVVHFLFF